jgi:hypothetical protein
VLLEGKWGDQFLAGVSHLADLVTHLRWGEAFQHFREYPRWHIGVSGKVMIGWIAKTLLWYGAPDWAQPFAYQAHQRWRDRADPYDVYSEDFRSLARDSANGLVSRRRFHSYHAMEMYTEARSWRTYQHREWQDKSHASLGVQPAFPFLDTDLVGYLMGVPGSAVMDSGVPKAILRRAMRDLLPGTVRNRRDKGDATDINLARIVKNWGGLVDRVSRDSLAVAAGFLDSGKLASAMPAIARGISQGDPLAWRRAEDLLALEVWLERWIGASPH